MSTCPRADVRRGGQRHHGVTDMPLERLAGIQTGQRQPPALASVLHSDAVPPRPLRTRHCPCQATAEQGAILLIVGVLGRLYATLRSTYLLREGHTWPNSVRPAGPHPPTPTGPTHPKPTSTAQSGPTPTHPPISRVGRVGFEVEGDRRLSEGSHARVLYAPQIHDDSHTCS